MKQLKSYMLAVAALLAVMCSSCIEDGFSTDPADQPAFSAESVDIGEVFTGDISTTFELMVYNKHSKGLNISSIKLDGGDADCFRLNVDGVSGTTFSDVEIRANDSIYVLIEAQLPENGDAEPRPYSSTILFETNGRNSSVAVTATGRDVIRLTGVTLDADTQFTAEMPYVIFDSLVVASGTTLTVEPGAELLFHDSSELVVRGTLKAEGTSELPITFSGDRIGKLVGDIDFDIMSRQWAGAFFTATSTGNSLSHVIIKNTVQGVTVSGDGTDTADAPRLDMLNCVLRNSAYNVLETYHASVRGIGCEFAEGGTGLVSITGGSAVFNQCTFANNYLYAVISGPALTFAHVSADPDTGLDDGSGMPYLSADISNSIIYGYGGDVSIGDLEGTDIYLRRCLLKGEGEDDDHFVNIMWDTDPLFYTVRLDYFFDYRLQEESPAIGAADASLMLPQAAYDFYGLPRNTETPDLGAYVYDPDYQPDTEE